MTFLHPILALAGLSAVAIPIILHLLMRRRRTPIMYGAMRFLVEAYRKHRRRLTLEQLLLLAARCLLLALIAVALGRPLLGSAMGARTGPTTLYLLIDNSLASSVRDGESSDLDGLETRAAALLDRLDAASGDRVALIALAAPARAIVLPASYEFGTVSRLIEGLEPTDAPMDLPGGIELVRGAIEGEGDRAPRSVVAVLSRFRLGSTGQRQALSALPDGVSVLAADPARDDPGNVTIVGLEPVRSVLVGGPGGTERTTHVRIRLARSGRAVARAAITSVSVALVRGDRVEPERVIGRASVRWVPGQEEAQTPVSVRVDASDPGPRVLLARIDADAIRGDNLWQRPIDIRDRLRVGLIAPRRFGLGPGIDRFSPGDWFRVALDPAASDPGSGGGADLGVLDLVQVDPGSLSTPRLAGLDAAIIPDPQRLDATAWGMIGQFAQRGGLVIVSPPADVGVHLWPDAMSGAMGIDWTIAREAVDLDEPVAISPEPPASGSADLLTMLWPELPVLGRAAHVNRLVPIVRHDERTREVLSLADGQTLIWAVRPGAADARRRPGLVIYLATAPDLDWTDLPAKPLMVPLVHELIRQGVGSARSVTTAVAGRIPALARGASRLVWFGKAGGADSAAGEPIRVRGLWRVIDDRGSDAGVLAVNADAAAGRVQAQPVAEIEGWLSGLGQRPRWLEDPDGSARGAGAGVGTPMELTPPGGQSISVGLLVGAVLLGLIEAVLARRCSHASIARGGARDAAAPLGIGAIAAGSRGARA